MKKKVFSLRSVNCFILLFIAFFNANSQREDVRFMTHKEWESVLNKKPKDQKRWQEFELFARMYSRYARPDEKVLPLVFNIIETSGQTKVTDQQIYSQIEVLNKAFTGEYKPESERMYNDVVAGDTKIRFCMGTPLGNKPGISKISKGTPYTVVNLPLISSKKDGIEGAKKDEYINIWITDMPENMSGYAVMPDVDEAADGIYIDPDYFGQHPESKLYTDGKTLVHLMGRYLGLHPLWTDMQCTDDGIEDTPIHNAPNYLCFPFSHISLCGGNEEEMIGNFMDATPDACSYMFTKGQMARMHAVLGDRGYRKSLMGGKKICGTGQEEVVAESRSIISEIELNIIPNPTKTNIKVDFSVPEKALNIQVEVRNTLGQVIYSQTIPSFGESNGTFNIDMSSLSIGTYYLTMKNGTFLKSKTITKI
jgi:hypothetical protein